jgi:hypothetical protein
MRKCNNLHENVTERTWICGENTNMYHSSRTTGSAHVCLYSFRGLYIRQFCVLPPGVRSVPADIFIYIPWIQKSVWQRNEE